MVQNMGVRNLVVRICVVTLLAAIVGVGALPVRTAQAQVSAFLATPYYGNATTISQWFDPPNHYGIDFLLRYERVLAAAEGTITELDWDTKDDRCLNDPDNKFGCGYGLHIRIQHAHDYDDYLTIYGHLSTAIGSTSGPESGVGLGKVIGTSGNTGWSTGPHLHFEVRHDNVRVDPFDEGGVSLWLYGACTATDGNRCSGTPLPAPPEAGSIIIDDGDTGFSRGYTTPYPYPWTYATDAGYNGDTYYGSNTTSSTYYRWAKWKPSLSSSTQGMYEVYVHVPSKHATTLRAKYTVNHASGSTEALVVQAALPHTGWPNSTWVNIGTYFLSPDSGSVKITNQTDEWDADKYVGADAVRFTRLALIYLPDTRASGGWNSNVVVRANGGNAYTLIDYLNASGDPECSMLNLVSQAGSWESSPSWCTDPSSIRSAVVYASQDVSVVVENSGNGRYNNYNGISASGLDPGWGQTGTDIYVPLVKYRYGVNDKISHFYILNTGSANASITIRGYDTGGYARFTLSKSSLAPNALWSPRVPYASGYSRLSAWIDSDQPLAIVVGEEEYYDSSTIYKIQNVFASGDGTVFVPQVKRTSSDFTTLAVQNLGSSSTNVTVNYYGGSCSTQRWWVAPNAYHVFEASAACPLGFVGSARVSGGQPLAVLVNEKGEKGYSGFLAGSHTIVLPRVRRDSGWWTGIRVMNVDGGSSTSGTIYFYNSNGSSAGSASFSIADGYHSVNKGSSVPSGFNGSAVITANRPIVASVILTLNGSTQQTMMYNGSNH